MILTGWAVNWNGSAAASKPPQPSPQQWLLARGSNRSLKLSSASNKRPSKCSYHWPHQRNRLLSTANIENSQMFWKWHKLVENHLFSSGKGLVRGCLTDLWYRGRDRVPGQLSVVLPLSHSFFANFSHSQHIQMCWHIWNRCVVEQSL